MISIHTQCTHSLIIQHIFHPDYSLCAILKGHIPAISSFEPYTVISFKALCLHCCLVDSGSLDTFSFSSVGRYRGDCGGLACLYDL